ncbi:MAG: hypothetical protein MI864_11695 [Pseudomonadales bacterium]|nr:hypothetical protein [Pseudomonadales bacterium]
MIAYKFPEERNYALHYATKMNDSRAIELLETGEVRSEEDAEYFSEFFWRMVDSSIEDEENGLAPIYTESNEFWNEKLLYSISGHLERIGFGMVWERVSDSK